MAGANSQNPLTQVEGTLDEYFGKKAPALPQNIKEIIVKIAPYLVIISLIFAIPAILALFGIGSLATVLSPLGGARSVAGSLTIWVGTILIVSSVILEIMAVPGRFSRKITAWRYMFWAQLITIISILVQINIVGALLSTLIGFYILFQIKSLYK